VISQGDEFIVSILHVYSNVLSARFKNKRGMMCMHVLIIRLIIRLNIKIFLLQSSVDCCLQGRLLIGTLPNSQYITIGTLPNSELT
jgi:hypothetical protein